MLQGSLALVAAGDAPHLSTQQHLAFLSNAKDLAEPIPGAEPSECRHPRGAVPIPAADGAGCVYLLLCIAPTSPTTHQTHREHFALSLLW